jgi:tetratricopeptide (TPR) repeat protein
MPGSDAETQSIECATCEKPFTWREVYWQETTPGAPPPRSRGWEAENELARAFCPHCGTLVAEAGRASWLCDPNEPGSWQWVASSESRNRGKTMPPGLVIFAPWWDERRLPARARVPYTSTTLDQSLLRPLQAREAGDYGLQGKDAAFFSRCLEPAFQEQDESRNYRSDPALRSVLDPLNAGDNKKAAKKAEKLTKRFPDLDTIYVWWGRACINSGDHRKARRALLSGLERARRKFMLCCALGELEWREGGDLQEAVYWWAQSLHCQESLEALSDESVYLYLHYVAEARGETGPASALITRVDRIRGGQVRLNPATEAQLRAFASQANGPGIAAVLNELTRRYLLN